MSCPQFRVSYARTPSLLSTALLLTLLLVAMASSTAAALEATEVALVINGQPVQPDVAPRIVSGRTLVPIRVVSENLGALVGWDETSRMVTVALANRVVQLVVGETAATVDGQRVELDVPSQIVNGRTLVPLRFVGESLGAHVDWDELTRTVAVNQTSPGDDGLPGEPGPVEPLVTGLAYRYTEAAGPTIIIDTNAPIEPVAAVERRPARIVVDLPGAVAGPDLPAVISVNEGMVHRLRSGQFDRDAVRVVADLSRAAEFTLLSDGHTTAIHPHQHVTDVSVSEGRGEVYVHIAGELPFGHRINVSGNDIVMLLPYAVLPDGDTALKPETPWLTGVALEQTELDDAPAVKVTINTRRYRQHRVITPDGDNAGLTLAIATDDGSMPAMPGYGPLGGRIIVVDAGHGGRDPGTLGYGGVIEKEITLHLARMLQQRLATAGATVVLTRSSDVYVDLYDRAEIANAARADVFVSLHLNGFDRAEMQGTETYYHPTSPAGKKLAQIVHEHVLQALRRPDRGVRSADFVVLRETAMPAVLLEPGFLTNPEESRLLLDPVYQQRLIDAVDRALQQFLSLPSWE